MKTFTSVDHDSHWPVGCASVIMAKDKKQARILLNKELKKDGLTIYTGEKKYTLQELKPNTAIILCNGEY